MENRQNKYFCLTYFSKLKRDQVEKKLWHFEDNPVSGGRKPCRKSRKSDTTFRWGLTYMLIILKKLVNDMTQKWVNNLSQTKTRLRLFHFLSVIFSFHKKVYWMWSFDGFVVFFFEIVQQFQNANTIIQAILDFGLQNSNVMLFFFTHIYGEKRFQNSNLVYITLFFLWVGGGGVVENSHKYAYLKRK